VNSKKVAIFEDVNKFIMQKFHKPITKVKSPYKKSVYHWKQSSFILETK